MINVRAAAEMMSAGRLTIRVDVDPEASIERKVEFRLAQHAQQRDAVATLDERLEDLEKSSAKQLDELRQWSEAHVAETMTQISSENRAIRVVGALLLAIGLGLSTAGNFVG